MLQNLSQPAIFPCIFRCTY